MIEAFTQRWQSISLRERYLLVALSAIVFTLVILQINTTVAAAKARMLGLSIEAVRSGDGVSEELWRGRAQSAAQGADSWQKASWSNPSIGVLQSQIERRLLELGTQAGLSRMNIDVDRTPLTVAETQMLRFRLSGSATYRDSTPKILAGLAANPQRLIIDEASVFFRGGDTGRLNISGLAPILLEDVTAPDAPVTTSANEGGQG